MFKALDLAHERTVAVKVLSPQLALETNFKVRFEREAQVLRVSACSEIPSKSTLIGKGSTVVVLS